MDVAIVIPAKNEEAGLASFLPKLREFYPDTEIIVVDDGSTDVTIKVSEEAGVKVVSHPYSKGNGAAVKTGARAARGAEPTPRALLGLGVWPPPRRARPAALVLVWL